MTAAAEGLVMRARSMGADFPFDGDAVLVSAARPLPADLMAELRQHRQAIGVYLARPVAYELTACICPVPIGPTGSIRYGICGLPLICPDCELCRGCRLCVRFPRSGCVA
jgi:hypothetical protein